MPIIVSPGVTYLKYLGRYAKLENTAGVASLLKPLYSTIASCRGEISRGKSNWQSRETGRLPAGGEHPRIDRAYGKSMHESSPTAISKTET